jgi:hypothetical protein
VDADATALKPAGSVKVKACKANVLAGANGCATKLEKGFKICVKDEYIKTLDKVNNKTPCETKPAACKRTETALSADCFYEIVKVCPAGKWFYGAILSCKNVQNPADKSTSSSSSATVMKLNAVVVATIINLF